MSKSEIIYTRSWAERARISASSKELENSIKNELFNFHSKNTTKLIIKKLELSQESYAFDAGCGWGRILVNLKHYLPNIRLNCVDLSQDFVNAARSLLEAHSMQHQVHITQGNLAEFELEKDEYDAFYSVRVLHYIADKHLVLSKLYDSLKTGGKGIIILPNYHCIYNRLTYKHAPLYPMENLIPIMEDIGYKNIETGSYGFIPHWLNISRNTPLYGLELGLRKMPLVNEMGGLAYAIGQK